MIPIKKRSTLTRVYPETLDDAKATARELSYLQGKPVSIPEVFRRALRVPSIKDVLRQDAIMKRRIGYGR